MLNEEAEKETTFRNSLFIQGGRMHYFLKLMLHFNQQGYMEIKIKPSA